MWHTHNTPPSRPRSCQRTREIRFYSKVIRTNRRTQAGTEFIIAHPVGDPPDRTFAHTQILFLTEQ